MNKFIKNVIFFTLFGTVTNMLSGCSEKDQEGEKLTFHSSSYYEDAAKEFLSSDFNIISRKWYDSVSLSSNGQTIGIRYLAQDKKTLDTVEVAVTLNEFKKLDGSGYLLEKRVSKIDPPIRHNLR